MVNVNRSVAIRLAGKPLEGSFSLSRDEKATGMEQGPEIWADHLFTIDNAHAISA